MRELFLCFLLVVCLMGCEKEEVDGEQEPEKIENYQDCEDGVNQKEFLGTRPESRELDLNEDGINDLRIGNGGVPNFNV